MRLSKIMLTTLLLTGVSVLSLGCASKSAPAPKGQVATVQRGNLSISITGVGNLALSQKVELAFELPGTVEEVLVKEGDSVKEGQVLAKLDTSAWEDQVTALEDKVIAAERNVTAKERAVTTKKRAVLSAQISLNNAELALEKIEETSTDPVEIEIKKLELELAKGKLEDAQIEVEDAKEAVKDAKKALEDARKALDEAKEASPEVKAPFAGFITNVNVKGGDEVTKGKVAVTLADPSKFEANILVNEMDIPNVKLGGNASVRVDATSGLSLSANVTQIAPTATIQSGTGVVNYKVKVEVQSLQAVMQERPQARVNVPSDNTSSGRQQQRQQPPAGQPGGQQGQTLTTIPQDFQLKEGMTVTVSIIVQQKSNVLLVPKGAITQQGVKSYVKVSKESVIEDREIKTGLSNQQYTEVTEGLSEGEKVIVPEAKAATTTGTTSQQRPPGGMITIFR